MFLVIKAAFAEIYQINKPSIWSAMYFLSSFSQFLVITYLSEKLILFLLDSSDYIFTAIK